MRKPLHDILDSPEIENELCKKCAFVKICTTCEGNNYESTGSCFNRTTYHCRFFKASLLATAKLMLMEHPEDLHLVVKSQSKEEQLQQLKRLLTIRVVNELCNSES